MLELSHLTKRYGERLALDDVSFTVGAGRLTGFVGGNGAGKTTTMRIVLGVLAADAGRVALHGSPITELDRRRFGYMPEERGLYPKMRLLEQIVYFARLHGWSPAAGVATPSTCSSASASANGSTTRSNRSRSETSSGRRSRRRSCTGLRCSCSTSRSPVSIRWRSRPCNPC
jgi:ABC-type multidrug transport system ATPase subunit